MSLSVNGYGQQALLYQLMRRNGPNAQPAEENAPAATPSRAAASASSSSSTSSESVSISAALAEFLGLLGNNLAAVTEPATASPDASPTSAETSDFDATLASLETAPQASDTGKTSAPNGAADLASVLDAYAAIASGAGG